MKDLEKIAGLWTLARQAGESAVLATVVQTKGSSYRLPGARLLITANGRRTGSISGGCLEDDLVKKAWWLTEAGHSVVRRYDTTSDGELLPAFGLGCNGVIDVLCERLTPSDTSVLDLMDEVMRTRKPAVIAHVIRPAAIAGQRLQIDTAGITRHDLGNEALAVRAESEARQALAEQASRTSVLADGVEVFLEVLTPRIHLVVFGAGDDTIPVTDLAKYLGWEVTVFDGRAHYARPERFPNADRVCLNPQSFVPTPVPVDPWTAAVLMTHSYAQDLEALRHLAMLGWAYFGVLGPRQRTLQLLEDAGLESADLAAMFHSPVGLDIGADGPDQVALAIVAEIQGTVNGREGGPLRHRVGTIHSRENGSIPVESASRFSLRSIACS